MGRGHCSESIGVAQGGQGGVLAAKSFSSFAETSANHLVSRLAMLIHRRTIYSITCNSYSDNEAAASLLFLATAIPHMNPVPGRPCEVSSLNSPYGHVGEEQMPVRHGAHIEEQTPGHCGISREASMACRAASCSASWRRRSRAKRKRTMQIPQSVQPARFQ